MAGNITEDCGSNDRSVATEGMPSVQRCQSGDSIAEWRSSEQVENGTPSTSPPYWDTDEDDDCGPKPSELYGRFTWKVENFSTINKRELKSNAFEVGGYKWYILIYPQGCDVCNHLSLFLCVANHDKLLPGWSHFAQFTIAVVNKDPKKSKYSDTLHRFWKKEHDWGWKKFMELSKVYDGFIVADTLVIKAQVQVIREKAYRPFRCLDCQYRRELVRVYLSNVEQICRRFIEDRRDKFKKLIEDKLRWPSFCAFWLGVDTNSRHRLLRDKSDTVLKIVVKHFFIEKEVTSTLVMDSLYSGLKALECQSKNKKGRAVLVELEELPAPMIHIDKDMFVLADDVVVLLERAATESLPHQPLPPKDDKSSQNRTKEGNSGEDYNKDSVERDERRLMELGRRTVEIFILAHIFSSRIEVSYQEAVALKRQEELIREEEAAWQAKKEIKAKHGASEKEKRARKKQAKQKRNNRKGKDKGSIGRFDVLHEKLQPESPSDDIILDGLHSKPMDLAEKIDTMEDASDLSFNGDDAIEMLQCDLDDREYSPTNWDTDTSEVPVAIETAHDGVQNGQIGDSTQTAMDDSSSTCSIDSVPLIMNGSSREGSLPNNNNQSSPDRGENQQSEVTYEKGSSHIANCPPADYSNNDAPSCNIDGGKASVPETEATELSLKNKIQLQKHLIEDDDIDSLMEKVSIKDHTDSERSSNTRATVDISSSSSHDKKPLCLPQQPNQTTEIGSTVTNTTAVLAEPPLNIASQSNKSHPLTSKLPPVSNPTSETKKQTITESSTISHEVNAMSRPSSAPLIPAPRPIAHVVSTIPTAPSLSRFISAAGRLGSDPSAAAPSYVPESYRNVMMGRSNIGDSAPVLAQLASSGQGMNYSQPASQFLRSGSMLSPHASPRSDQMPCEPGFTFGSVKPEAIQVRRQLWRDDAEYQATSSSGRFTTDLVSNTERFHTHGDVWRRQYSAENDSTASPYQAQEEFPHLDIINDLLDEEHSHGKTGRGLNNFNRQYSFPGYASVTDMESSRGSYRFDQSELSYDGGGFQRAAYGSSSSPLHRLRDGHLSQQLSAYTNGQVEVGLTQNGWPYGGYTDVSILNRRNGDVNGYSHRLPEYTRSTTGINKYMFGPASGR